MITHSLHNSETWILKPTNNHLLLPLIVLPSPEKLRIHKEIKPITKALGPKLSMVSRGILYIMADTTMLILRKNICLYIKKNGEL